MGGIWEGLVGVTCRLLASFAGFLSPNTLKAHEATGYKRATIKHSALITVNLQEAELIQKASLIPKNRSR